MRRVALWFLGLYQKFFTLFSFGSCRYYPTCSEYAKWLFEYDNLILAFLKSALRILRCNQLFKGGIDYPTVGKSAFKKPPLLLKSFNNTHIAVWFVPTKKSSFFVVKSLRNLNKF
ncbi:MAG: membrane protein insertion efficiency factor YidD [Campylobacteraceae bacterium]|jgi:putative membrane protein insertion efficiency factor|nr:membrane protein insertion efficiency factor YidD [Campylobacteraceae bacterium]